MSLLAMLNCRNIENKGMLTMESQLTRYLSGQSSAAFYVFVGMFISPLVPIVLFASIAVTNSLTSIFALHPAALVMPSVLFGLALTVLFSGSLYVGIYRHARLNTGYWRWVLILSALCHIVVVAICTMGYLMMNIDIAKGW